jgi:uncharacterized protein
MGSQLLTIGGRETARWTDSRKGQLLELLVFLFLLAPSIVLSYFTLRAAQPGFGYIAVATMLRESALLSLIALFLWRNGEPMARVGWWTGAGAAKEAAIGVALFPPVLLIGTAIDRWLRTAGLSGTAPAVSHSMTPSGTGELVLAAVLVAVVAICEETIFRGYLILRLQALTGSAAGAVFLATVLFSAGHAYEGVAGLATVFTLGLVLACVYVWRGSLIAPVVIHFLQDFISLVVLPVLVQR